MGAQRSLCGWDSRLCFFQPLLRGFNQFSEFVQLFLAGGCALLSGKWRERRQVKKWASSASPFPSMNSIRWILSHRKVCNHSRLNLNSCSQNVLGCCVRNYEKNNVQSTLNTCIYAKYSYCSFCNTGPPIWDIVAQSNGLRTERKSQPLHALFLTEVIHPPQGYPPTTEKWADM